MDINSTFGSSLLTATTSLKGEKTQQSSFVRSLDELSKSHESHESHHQKAIKAFHEVHQRSQITGVPTTEYNQSIAALGLDKGQTFAATDMLNKAGYDTGMPSVADILRYGNTNGSTSAGVNGVLLSNSGYGVTDLHKDSRFSINNTNASDRQLKVDQIATGAQIVSGLETDTDLTTAIQSPAAVWGAEIDQLHNMYMAELGRPADEEGLELYGRQLKAGVNPAQIRADIAREKVATGPTAIDALIPSRNFYDAAVAVASQLSSTDLKKPVDQVAQQVNNPDYQIIVEQLAKSYMDNLQMKQSIESLDTLLG